MASYPSSVWAGNTRGTNLSDLQTHTTWHDDVMGEVVAVQSELGTSPSSSFATVTARFTSIVADIAAIDVITDTIDTSSATFVPTWTNLSVGTGTVSARQASIGPFQFFYVQVAWGTTTSISGAVSMAGLPANIFLPSNATILSKVELVDTSAAATYHGTLSAASATTVNVRRVFDSGIAGNPSQEAAITATAPFPWANTDQLNMCALYLTA